MKTLVAMLVLAGLGTIVWYLLEALRGGQGEGGKAPEVGTELPPMLRGAKIWGKELKVSCRVPRRMHGTLDEAFQLESGEIVLSETKSRPRRVVHDSDIIQLSGYSVAVREGGRNRVSRVGFVRLVTPEGNVYRQVDLLDEQVVAAAHDKYRAITSGRDVGKKCGKESLCRTCLYKRECDQMG